MIPWNRYLSTTPIFPKLSLDLSGADIRKKTLTDHYSINYYRVRYPYRGRTASGTTDPAGWNFSDIQFWGSLACGK